MTILSLKGEQIAEFCDPLGELRIKVFADWPYLYRGNLNYERTYLKTYFESHHSMAYLIFDQEQLVGATTAILLTDEKENIKKPLIEREFDPMKVIYFGESILLPAYRGQGWGKVFMDKRLEFAAEIPQVLWATFCSVLRPDDHPLKPKDYRPLTQFWLQQGFQPVDGLTTDIEWLDCDQASPTVKPLQFWLKNIRDKKES